MFSNSKLDIFRLFILTVVVIILEIVPEFTMRCKLLAMRGLIGHGPITLLFQAYFCGVLESHYLLLYYLYKEENNYKQLLGKKD